MQVAALHCSTAHRKTINIKNVTLSTFFLLRRCTCRSFVAQNVSVQSKIHKHRQHRIMMWFLFRFLFNTMWLRNRLCLDAMMKRTRADVSRWCPKRFPCVFVAQHHRFPVAIASPLQLGRFIWSYIDQQLTIAQQKVLRFIHENALIETKFYAPHGNLVQLMKLNCKSALISFFSHSLIEW